jgi:hypothetical protein
MRLPQSYNTASITQRQGYFKFDFPAHSAKDLVMGKNLIQMWDKARDLPLVFVLEIFHASSLGLRAVPYTVSGRKLTVIKPYMGPYSRTVRATRI